MALTKQQEGLLKLQIQHTPEFKTGLYESEPQLGFGDVFSPPVGPLYNVDQVPGSESYFEGPENFENYGQTAGPLRNIDLDRTTGIIQALEAKDPTGQLTDDYMNTFRMTDAGDPYQVVQSRPTKYAEFQQRPYDDLDLTPRMDISTVPAQEEEGVINYGYTYGPTIDSEGLPQTGTTYINPELAKYITTKPMSPANQLPIFDSQTAQLGMYGAKPEDLMRKAVDTIQHEYAHNILDLPGFENIIEGAKNAPIPSNLKLKGPPGSDLSEKNKEEIFNRAIDIERYYRQYGELNNPIVEKDLDYVQDILDKKYKRDKDSPWSSALSYVNSMRPQVLKYFDEVDRQSKMGYINKQKTKRGMPEHLGDAGQSLDDMSGVKKKAAPPGEKGGPGYVTPKKKIKARHAPHPDRGGGRRPDKPGGFTDPGKDSYGPHKAHGGLIDVPFSGRSRYI